VRVHSGTDPPGETTLDPWLDDPFPDYDTEPVVRSTKDDIPRRFGARQLEFDLFRGLVGGRSRLTPPERNFLRKT
jgi:hypothetical protein